MHPDLQLYSGKRKNAVTRYELEVINGLNAYDPILEVKRVIDRAKCGHPDETVDLMVLLQEVALVAIKNGELATSECDEPHGSYDDGHDDGFEEGKREVEDNVKEMKGSYNTILKRLTEADPTMPDQLVSIHQGILAEFSEW